MSEHELRVEAGGLGFRVLAAGPASGEPVMLLHGFPEGAGSWRHQIAALAAAGHRVLAPDLRGFGGSDAPDGVESYRMALLVEDVRGLLDAFEIASVNLAGHDWGALIGWSFASLHPGRLRSWTAVSVGHPDAFARAAGFTAEPPDPDQRARSTYIGVFRREGEAEAILASHDWGPLRNMYRIGPNPDAYPDDAVDELVAGFARPGRMTAALNYYRANLHRRAYLESPPCPNPITTPTTYVWGGEDQAVGRRSAEATGGLVSGPYRFIELAGAGHWLLFERPDEVSAAILERIAGWAPPN